MPSGVATLMKTRVFNSHDYRNGGQIPIKFERSVDAASSRYGKQMVACKKDDFSSESDHAGYSE